MRGFKVKGWGFRVLPQDRPADFHPSREETLTRLHPVGKSTETTTVSQRAVVTYNGTKDVPMQIGVYLCTLHLDSHKVDGCK